MKIEGSKKKLVVWRRTIREANELEFWNLAIGDWRFGVGGFGMQGKRTRMEKN